jgi:serine/threonine-protein kinase
VGIAIPDLSGHDPAEAANLLSSLGITVGPPQTQSSGTIPSGRVIGTSPGVGTVVLPGQPVSLIVSSGPPSTPTPTPSPS